MCRAERVSADSRSSGSLSLRFFSQRVIAFAARVSISALARQASFLLRGHAVVRSRMVAYPEQSEVAS